LHSNDRNSDDPSRYECTVMCIITAMTLARLDEGSRTNRFSGLPSDQMFDR